MRFLFIAVRFFPYWALALALLCGELGLSYRRKGKKIQHLYWFLSCLILILTAVWFLLGGYSQSDNWVRAVFG